VFFDPRSADSIAGAIASIITDRDAILSRQVAGFSGLKARTWQNVACEWMSVFEEAVRRPAAQRWRTPV
jgi:hypothetical protein